MRRRVVRPIHILAIVAATYVGGSSAAAQSIRDSTPERNVWSARHRRIVGVVGVASVHSFVCGEDSGCDSGVRNVALAFAGEAFVHASVIGIGVDAFGALGARRASYAALALTLQLGWLGVAP